MKTKRVFHKENILNFHKKVEERKTDKINIASGGYYNNKMYICIHDLICICNNIHVKFYNFYRIVSKNQSAI